VTDLVNYEVANGVAHIELNRPDAANAFDLPTSRALGVAVRRAAEDEGARAVLVTGAGSRFCAGGDVSSFVSADDAPAYLRELALDLDAGVRMLAEMPKPVVAAVHGAVAGAGLALMLSCDLVVAEESTKFVFAYPGVGLTPDCGVSYLLPRAIGQQRALAFALSNRPITATQARDWGMVAEVVEGAHVRARELAAQLDAGPAGAFGEARRLLRASWDVDRAAVGAEEAQTISQRVTTPEAQELIRRFHER